MEQLVLRRMVQLVLQNRVLLLLVLPDKALVVLQGMVRAVHDVVQVVHDADQVVHDAVPVPQGIRGTPGRPQDLGAGSSPGLGGHQGCE